AVGHLEEHGPRRKVDPKENPDAEEEGEEVEIQTEFDFEVARVATNILKNPSIAEQIARVRGDGCASWKPETILQLAEEGVLGWDGGKLVFIYQRGLSARPWPGGKEFIRKFWKPEGPWRYARLAVAHTVTLTEGETDAISLIDAGYEEEPGVVVIACPGANSFKPKWAPLFAGKRVNIAFDNDKAGERGTDEVAMKLEPYADEIYCMDWTLLAQEAGK
ncbi:MAG: toprim domain-containing protein, partial [Terrimicrobiaceae bacterium]